MKLKNLRLKISLLALLPLMLLIREVLYKYPDFTERVYSRGLYPVIISILSRITGGLSISLAEQIVVGTSLALIFKIAMLIYSLFKSRSRLQIAVNWLLNMLCTISLAYCLFLLLWGFNYYRQPLAYSLNYTIEKSTVTDLKELCSNLIEKTNYLRTAVSENNNGIMYLEGGFFNTAKRSNTGYKVLSDTYPFLSGYYGEPKGIILSRQLCYTGIAGIYFPFTGEANVNKLVPDALLPSTMLHEMAHQKGFAREDEANFMAYLACKAHPDTDFQYSGYLLAAIYSMNALAKHDIEGYKELSAKYSDGVKRDLRYNSDFWKQFEGPVEQLQEKVNDSYLKSNKQSDGIYSYGRMVDLLLAE